MLLWPVHCFWTPSKNQWVSLTGTERPCVTARSFANIVNYHSKQQDTEKTQCEGSHMLCHSSAYTQPPSQTIKGKEAAVQWVEGDTVRQDLLEPGSERTASCYTARGRSLQSDWSSGYATVPGSKGTQGHLPCLAQMICGWNYAASLRSWAQTAPCRWVNALWKAIQAFWRWVTVSSPEEEGVPETHESHTWWLVFGTPSTQEPLFKAYEKVRQRTSRNYVVIGHTARTRRGIKQEK